MKGIVFSIEEFAINDGPGIRTTVFLKGCPLRCVWCHNPEGLSRHPQVMHMRERDVICGREIEAAELAGMLNRDVRLFNLNGGGVTFTGGEPTMQADFLCEVLDLLPGVHKVIETCGYCSEDDFQKVLERVDMVLFDIKHSNPVTHRRYTGVDNGEILKNLSTLIDSGKRFIARIPLIPGVNDSLDNMMATAALLKNAPGLDRVELMPYHRTAGAKYAMVDLEYNPPFDVQDKPQIHLEAFGNMNAVIL